MREPASFIEVLQWSNEQCREYMAAQRWPDGVECPHCDAPDPYEIERRSPSKNTIRKLWKCRACKKQFSVTVGTVFERSRVPLQKWLAAVHLICSSKKGMSAHQIHRLLGVQYKTAWFMAHRLRYAMAQPPLAEKLSGTIEIDATYVGGKPRRGPADGRPRDEYGRIKRGPRPSSHPRAKAPVVALLERGGRVRSMHVERVTAARLAEAVRENVNPASELMSDAHSTNLRLGELVEGGLQTVNHSAGEYARGRVTTNTVEGYFGILKRGVYGTFHHVSKRHLHRYLAEFDHRYNTRQLSDAERAATVIRDASGKRLTYRPLAGGA